MGTRLSENGPAPVDESLVTSDLRDEVAERKPFSIDRASEAACVRACLLHETQELEDVQHRRTPVWLQVFDDVVHLLFDAWLVEELHVQGASSLAAPC